MRENTITPQGLADQQVLLFKTDTVPGQTNDFYIPQPCDQPQGKAGLKPLLIASEIVQHLLDLIPTKPLLFD